MSASIASTRRRFSALAVVTALLAGLFVATATSSPASADVGGSISGTVYGAGGAPLAGARLSLDFIASASSGETVAYTTSDANGHYTLQAAYPGYFAMSINGPVGSGYLYESWSNNEDFSSNYSVGLPTGRVITGRDITLSLGTTIAGNVKLGGANLAGVTVKDINADGYETGISAVTNASGNYTLQGITPGTHSLFFDASGTGAADAWNGNVARQSQSTTFTVTSAGVTGKNAVLTAGATYAGNVKHYVTENLANVYVELADADGRNVAYVYTNASGNFSLANLAAGTYSYRLRDYSGSKNVEQSGSVTLTTGQVSSANNFVLAQGASVTGTVLGPGSAPIQFAYVSLIDPSTGFYAEGANTDASGAYEIRGVKPGTYKLIFTKDGYQTQWWNNAASLATATTITVSGTTSQPGKNATLTTGATITGQVTSGVPGIALTNPRVQVIDTEGNNVASATVQSDGTYSVSGVPAGSFSLVFRGSGGLLLTEYLGGARTLEAATFFPVSAGATVTGKNASLDPLASVSGHVQNASAADLDGVTVELYNAAGNIVDSAVTDAGGDYAISYVAAGTYTLKFIPDAGDSLPTEWWNNQTSQGAANTFTVALGEQVTGKDAELGVPVVVDDGTISGTVLNRTGGGVANATVVAYLTSGGQTLAAVEGSAVTNSSGAFTISGLPGGSFTLGVSTASGGYSATTGALLPSTGGYVSIWAGNAYSFAAATPTAIDAHGSASGVSVTIQNPAFADVGDPTSSVYDYIEWMYYQSISTGTAQPSGKPLYVPGNSVSRQAMASFLYKLSGDTFTAPATATFADVAVGSTFFTAVEWMAAEGISTGTPQSSGKPLFKPADAVSRQAMATFLSRYEGAVLPTPTTQSFADVPLSAGTAAAIEWMKTTGISTGTPQSSGLPLYKPVDPVSRQAMAAFLYRLAHLGA